MADYVVEPIKPQRSLADIISDAVDAGLSDAEIKAAVAKRNARLEADSPYKPTNYAAGAAKLPSKLTEADKAGIPTPEDDSGANVFTRFMHRALPETRQYRDPMGQRVPAPDDVIAHDPTAQAVLTGMLGAGAGTLAAGAGPVISGAVNSTTQALTSGTRSPKELLLAAGSGAAAPAATALLKRAGTGIVNSPGGQARQFIESHGGEVGPGTAGRGIAVLDAVPHVTDEAIGAQSRTAGRQLLDAAEKQFDETGRQPYRAAVGAIDKGQGRNLVDVTPIRRKMIEVAQHPSTDPATARFLESQIADIDSKFPDVSGMGRRLAPESWVNGKTSMLWDRANPSKLAVGAGSVQDAKLADVASVGQAMREQGPYGDINAKYRAAKQAHGDFREALGAARKPNANELVDENKIALTLGRRGQNTITAGQRANEAKIADLVARNPELESVIDSPALLRAKGDLQFHLGNPAHGGLIDRIGLPVGGMVAAGAMAAGHGPKALLALGAAAAAQNAKPIAGRLLYGPAQAAASMAQPSQMAIAAAAAARRQQDAAVIHTLFGTTQPQQGNDNAEGH